MQSKAVARIAVIMAALMSGTSCSTLSSVKDSLFGGSAPEGPERLTGFIGAVLADEPRAALAGREVLALGGTAADAAVAVGFTLSVTLASRAGLGAGGACLAYNPKRDGPGQGSPEAIMFTSPVPQSTPAGADRPAAVPMLARGLFALHARYGSKPFESLLAGPEQMARFGVPISRALVRDLATVAGPLATDPNARAVFVPGGNPLAEGGTLLQPDLGATLSQLRIAGVGDLYQGSLARRLEDASRLAGGPIALDAMRAALPRTGGPIVVRAGRDSIAFLPVAADRGLAASTFQALQNQSAAPAAAATPMPASTGFSVLDKDGNAVTCVTSMNNLFGTGRIAPGTGILLAAAPRPGGTPLLSAAIAWNESLRGFRAAVTGSGQEGAALAVATALGNTLGANTPMPVPVPEPGRANVIACARYLPDRESSCAWAVDPRGFGLAAASN